MYILVESVLLNGIRFRGDVTGLAVAYSLCIASRPCYSRMPQSGYHGVVATARQPITSLYTYYIYV